MINSEVEKILLKVQKPARYTGGEFNEVQKNPQEVDVRVAFCFPDTYEIGMSHLGMKILYSLKNARDNIYCERVFAPYADMEEQMRKNKIELYGLESGDSIKNFDFICFTLQYELSYSNILNMLDLANIPLLAKDRTSLSQIVLVGGPCAYNCEPIADFVDVAIMGEGEEINLKVIDIYNEFKKAGKSKEEFLLEIAKLEGVYIPAFYDVTYNDDGTINKIAPNKEGVPATVKKTIIKDLDNVYYPDKFIVPHIETVHDRIVLEMFRGCIRGCRFCQAGFVYRPVREKSPHVLKECAKELHKNTGYEEMSLSSLSTSDYTGFNQFMEEIMEYTKSKKINLSLPSLRVDNFTSDVIKFIKKMKKGSLTLAPEAGSQRLRDAINKNVYESELLDAVTIAFNEGYTSLKLYFMIGLPTETYEDIKGIADLAYKVLDCYYKCENRNRRKQLAVTISVSSFVPKAFTPFQWEGQDTMDVMRDKQTYLKKELNNRKISLSYTHEDICLMEGVFARGDRRLGKVLLEAFKLGCKMDGWQEHFDFAKWQQAFANCEMDTYFYANRKRELDEVLPWSHIDIGVGVDYLKKELATAYKSETTKNCREECGGCGANKMIGGKCK